MTYHNRQHNMPATSTITAHVPLFRAAGFSPRGCAAGEVLQRRKNYPVEYKYSCVRRIKTYYGRSDYHWKTAQAKARGSVLSTRLNNILSKAVLKVVPNKCLRVCVLTCLICWPTIAWADQIITTDNNYIGVGITGVVNGQVEFRSAAGQPHSVAIDSIKQFVLADVRRFADFNEAERLLAGGDPTAAILRYNRARRGLEGFWKDVASSRLIAACDGAGRFEEAVRHFIITLRSQAIGPVVASRLMPVSIPAKRNSQAIRAIEQLDAAIKSRPGPVNSAVLALLRFDIIRQTGDRRLEQTAKRVAALSLPPDLRNERFYNLIYIALSQPIFENDKDQLINYIDRAILDCPTSSLPDFLLLKGKTLLASAKTQDDIIRASWPLMRVAIHMPNDARAAVGLFETARVMEKLNRPAKALELYRECADHPQVEEKLKLQAQAEIVRLSTK